MHRKPEALQDLNALLVNKKDEPFVWGKWDCCIFSADCVLAMTGEDKINIFRGAYFDKRTAATLLREQGQGTLVKTIEHMLGSPTSKHMAWRGDIVIRKNNVGVCVGTQAAFVAEEGLMLFPMHEIEKVYPIR